MLATTENFIIKSQRGAFGPLLAVIGLALLTVLIVYGIDSSTVRRASKALEQYNEQVCRQVASRPLIHKDSLESFQRQIQAAVDYSLVPHVTISGANISIPTMPEEGDFGFNGSHIPSPPFVATPKSFEELGVSACSIACEDGDCDDCIFSGNVNTSPQFPGTMWNNLTNAGNTVACELTGQISTVLSGHRTISARSVWGNRVRGLVNAEPTPVGVSEHTGLTLIIAPELQTRAGDPRFRFSTNPAIFNHSFRESYDPLYDFNSGASPGLNAFNKLPATDLLSYPLPLPTGTVYPTPTFPAGTPAPTAKASVTSVPVPGTATPFPIEVPKRVSAICRGDLGIGSVSSCANTASLPEQSRALLGGASDYGLAQDCMAVPSPLPGTNCVVPSDREELLAACLNPPTLIRNILSGTFLELAMRHGELRQMTEVLVANPRHRNENAGPLARKNNPAQIIAHGEDLAERNYQLPFVSYDSGGNIFNELAGMPPKYGSHGFGVINPFGASDPDSSRHQINFLEAGERSKVSSVIDYHKFVSNQLRNCYHLYHPGNNTALKRFDIEGLVNDNFEPTENNPTPAPYAFLSALRPTPYPQTKDLWDQELPWGGGTPKLSRGLNGPELASALGSVQTCPFYEADLPAPPFPTPPLGPTPPAGKRAGYCLKPQAPENDLRGDLFGSLCYLKGKASSTTCDSGSTSTFFPALKQPGMFAIQNSSAPNPGFDTPQWSDAYAEPLNTKTPVVLLTHQALDPDDISRIQSLISEGHFDLRPITVIFVQAWEDSSNPGLNHNRNHLRKIIDDFKAAFHIPDEFQPNQPVGPGNRDNALIVFSPYLLSFNGCDESLDTPASCFSKYWAFLLDPVNQENINVAATNIFYNRILKLYLKL